MQTQVKNKKMFNPLYKVAASILFFANAVIEKVKIGGIKAN